MEIKNSVLAGLSEQEQVQARHYVAALERIGTFTDDRIEQAVEKYARGLIKHREDLLEQSGHMQSAQGGHVRRASTKMRKVG